jgi:hypothetical protein
MIVVPPFVGVTEAIMPDYVLLMHNDPSEAASDSRLKAGLAPNIVAPENRGTVEIRELPKTS